MLYAPINLFSFILARSNIWFWIQSRSSLLFNTPHGPLFIRLGSKIFFSFDNIYIQVIAKQCLHNGMSSIKKKKKVFCMSNEYVMHLACLIHSYTAAKDSDT